MNKNLEFTSCPSAAVLSRHNLINVTTYREILFLDKETKDPLKRHIHYSCKFF